MVGSNTGLFVFDNTNPATPVLISQFTHVTGCDPVVCDDEVAYVTIKTGTTCNGTFNQLDVLDIKQLPQVNLLKTYDMTEPQGLTYKGEYLYVCDAGLKIYNRTNPLDLKLVKHISDIDGFDVIALPGAEVLMLVGKDGFFQYDITDPTQPVKISEIRTVK